ncbi:hypothetical protein HYN59_14085 [Flavobacterium album]|uniref:Nucleotide modification associated domain-containing protein n=1 Tax=Flavobacterium album TaxID=2175091 RepID=A0A2S1R0G2_9FLAO|nr:hypothetical protein [Flavobacterium album]AWH86167.1 hypothetical protein HYN59_14085 [Flavobacterium album]
MNNSKAHYIIFHPEHARCCVEVNATVKDNDTIIPNWKGKIYVDAIGAGNEDPFVFNDPWIYSYCHASQLRRNFRNDSFVQKGSNLVFVSGQDAEKGMLTVDTVFHINDAYRWQKNPLDLPNKFSQHYFNDKSDLWNRHLKFPITEKVHDSVSHTYEAKKYRPDNPEYSFLPLEKSGIRTSISFENIPREIRNKITTRIKGKYPALLSQIEMDIIISMINQKSQIQVLGDIILSEQIAFYYKKC